MLSRPLYFDHLIRATIPNERPSAVFHLTVLTEYGAHAPLNENCMTVPCERQQRGRQSLLEGCARVEPKLPVVGKTISAKLGNGGGKI